MNSQIVHFHPCVMKRLAITSTSTLTFYFKRTLKDKREEEQFRLLSDVLEEHISFQELKRQKVI